MTPRSRPTSCCRPRSARRCGSASCAAGFPSSSSSTIAATIVLETVIETGVQRGRSSSASCSPAAPWARSARRSTPSAARSATRPRRSSPFRHALALRSPAAVKFLGLPRAVAADMRRGFAVVGAPAALGWSVLAWKLLAWTFRLATVDFFLVAFHIPATAWTVLLVVAAQVAASLVPLLPGNAGAQQAALVVGPGRLRDRGQRRRARSRDAGRHERDRPPPRRPGGRASSPPAPSCDALVSGPQRRRRLAEILSLGPA